MDTRTVGVLGGVRYITGIFLFLFGSNMWSHAIFREPNAPYSPRTSCYLGEKLYFSNKRMFLPSKFVSLLVLLPKYSDADSEISVGPIGPLLR